MQVNVGELALGLLRVLATWLNPSHCLVGYTYLFCTILCPKLDSCVCYKHSYNIRVLKSWFIFILNFFPFYTRNYHFWRVPTVAIAWPIRSHIASTLPPLSVLIPDLHSIGYTTIPSFWGSITCQEGYTPSLMWSDHLNSPSFSTFSFLLCFSIHSGIVLTFLGLKCCYWILIGSLQFCFIARSWLLPSESTGWCTHRWGVAPS